MRRLVSETTLRPRQLILPMFVAEGLEQPRPIASMPGVVQHTRDTLRKAAVDAVNAGVGGLMLFGIPAKRDAEGSGGVDEKGILNVALRDLRAELGDATVLMADTCLDEFTDHGHCGVLDADGDVDNDATLRIYAEMAVAQAEAGAHVLGPSGMMDGQVGVIRRALDEVGHSSTAILAYASKFASAFYGPFREAADCAPSFGDRSAYQMDPPNAREALAEITSDIDEGADAVMVKPAGPYLDVLARARERFDLPLAAYQVSGEYAALHAAADRGWLDLRRAALESLTGIARAGADVIVTYFALDAAAWLAER